MLKSKNLIIYSNKPHLKEFFCDVAEMGLDEVIGALCKDSDILKELPIMKWLFIGNEIRTTIQSAHFVKKYACFIGPIAQVQETDELLSTLEDESIQQKVVDQTIIYLDRYHTEFKAMLLGELFVQTFVKHQFNTQEYNSLMFSIDQIHPFEGIEVLKRFYDYRLRMEAESVEEKQRDIWREGADLEYQALATTGLLKLPSGASSVGNLGGAYLNDMGKRFYERVVLNCEHL